MKKLGRRKSGAFLYHYSFCYQRWVTFNFFIIVVPNPGDSGNLELNSPEEFDQEIIEEVEQETIDPNKVENFDQTEFNTRF